MIAIVDYRAGNLASVQLAFAELGAATRMTSDPAEIRSADQLVFPGVGAAGAAMRNLRRLGVDDALRDAVARGTPFLGICLGTQIVMEYSEEDGGTACLGFLPGQVRLFRPADRSDKVPQIGWNTVALRRPHPVLAGIEDDSEFYFIHSYYPAPADRRLTIGETTYAGVSFGAIMGRDNIVATQFHPEKSGRIGLRLIANFCRWDGSVPTPC